MDLINNKNLSEQCFALSIELSEKIGQFTEQTFANRLKYNFTCTSLEEPKYNKDIDFYDFILFFINSLKQ